MLITGTPTSCFGRTELVAHVLRRALDLTSGYRQNVALVGPPLIGKSTVLVHLADVLRRHPPLLPVYLDIPVGTTLGEFTERFAATLLHRYAAVRGQETPATYEHLVRRCRPELPRTTSLLNRAIARARRGHRLALTVLFEAPGMLRQESGCLCVIMLDEFHRLAAWGTEEPFAALGRQIVVQHDTMYLLASSAVDVALRILRERLALLFGQFEVIPVGPFDLATGVQYLRDHAGCGIRDPAILIALAELTEGHPFSLDCVARALKGIGPTEDPSELARCHRVLEQLLGHPTGLLCQRCQQAVDQLPARRRPALMPVLLAIADGCHRVSAIAEATGKTAREATRAVRALREAGVVARQGVFCRVSHRLLRCWLRTTYRIQQSPVRLEPAVARDLFAAEFRRWVDASASRSPQAVLETVAQLLRRFGGEVVELHGRRVRLPTMDVHTLMLPGIPRAVVGRRGDAQWLCVPYTTPVRESDAVALIQTLRFINRPWERRLLIALDGVEVSARLVLQEQRWWVWELETVNQVLELYGLPRFLPPALQALAAISPGGPEMAAGQTLPDVTPLCA